MAAEPADVSEDGILGGRLVLRQPLKGHRVGHDAVLLAAATSVGPGDRAVELGAGVGAAGLAVARRVDDLAVTLVEIEPTLTALARENAARNQLAERVHALCLDVAAPPEVFVAAGLAAAAADHVLMNPPFNAAQNPSPERGRRLAHEAAPDSLTRWAETAALASSTRRHCHADLAGGPAGRSACGSFGGLRSARHFAGSPQTGGAGDPGAGTRGQGKPRVAYAFAGLFFER